MAESPKTTALWRHINAVYEAMAAEAEDVTINGQPAKLWEGFGTHLCSRLGIPIPYYSKLFRYLRVMGSADCIKRGAKTVPSQWALFKPPTEQAFMLAKKEVEKGRPKDLDGIEQQLADIRASLPKIDVVAALATMQKTITKLEKDVRELKKKKSA